MDTDPSDSPSYILRPYEGVEGEIRAVLLKRQTLLDLVVRMTADADERQEEAIERRWARGRDGTRDDLPAKGKVAQGYFWEFYDAAPELRRALAEDPDLSIIEACRRVAARLGTHRGTPENQRRAESIKKLIGTGSKGNGWLPTNGTVAHLLDRIERDGFPFDRPAEGGQTGAA